MDITSLQDYISLLDEKFNGQYFFRGESTDFGDTKNMASGYRWIRDNNRRFLDLIHMRHEYFREVGAHINAEEKANFIAYAQHHGLPTELLDITANPLVALYFAVSKNPDENGFVYLFDNNLYSLTERDKSQFILDLYNPDLARLDHLPVEKQFHKFFWTDKIDEDMIQKKLFEEVNSFVYRVFQKSEILDLRAENKRQLEKLNKSHQLKTVFNLSKFQRRFELRKIVLSREKPIDPRLSQCIAISETFDLIDATDGKYFPPLKYLLIQPSIVFDRMKNQQGAFIYQLNTSHGSASKGYMQPIIAADTLSIPSEHKQKILRQLDNVGINQMFIYSDDDNIAGYYKQNYSRSIQQELDPFHRP